MAQQKLVWILIGLLWLVSPHRAHAGPEGTFMQHYEHGLALYSDEDYEGAIREFQAAYAASPKPKLLFNLGQAHRQLGNARDALRFYQLYQAMEPSPKPGLKAELEGYIQQMKENIAAAEQAKRMEDGRARAESPLPHPGPPGPAAPVGPQSTRLVVPALALSVAVPEKGRRPLHRRPWFWGVIGGGLGAALIAGAVAGAISRRPGFDGDVRPICFDPPCR